MAPRTAPLVALAALALFACGKSSSGTSSVDGGHDAGADAGGMLAGNPDAGSTDAGGSDAGSSDAGPVDAGPLDAGAVDAGPLDAGAPCTTTITYGASWIHGSNHPSSVDVVGGEVTWDGSCVDTGGNGVATLSNGWQPYFTGNGRCVMNLDYANCPAHPAGCATRATYGPAWLPPANHPDQFDDVGGRLLWDGTCANAGSNSRATLSNGWTPTFSGNDACELSLRYTQCGGLYTNSVMSTGCADPGVLLDQGTYYAACTGGGFPLFTSTDLVSWTPAGKIFPSGSTPSWAASSYWAPEIHKVGGQYVAYFTARGADGILAVGAAHAPSPLGPFTDLGAPLVHSNSYGVIDPTEFEDATGQPYLVWKVDGNATGQPTPIYAQPLAPDGLSLTGSPTQLITNDLAWEGAVTEGPFVIERNGEYFLFYSGNSYASSSYAIGVARASSPLGPYTKLGPPIVSTKGPWVGPGHCSVVRGPSGAWTLVYHAWAAGQVNTPGSSRMLLVDTLDWANDWPRALEAPSATSQPLP